VLSRPRGQRAIGAADRRDAHLALGNAAHGDGVADRVERVAEDVEAYSGVTDTGRREGPSIVAS
jgi:hypothetical protein